MGRGLAGRLGLVHAANFLGHGIFLPFFPAWLASRGFSSEAVAALLAIPVGLRILLAGRLAGLGDARVSPPKLVFACHAALAAIFLAFPHADGFLQAALLMAAYALAFAPAIPVTDAVTLAAIRNHPGASYGRVRLWGSVSFASATLAGGALLGAAEPGPFGLAVPNLLAACAVAAALAALALPPATGPSAPRAADGPGEGAMPPARRLLLLGMLAAAALVQASHALLYSFSTIDWTARGIPDARVGLLWTLGVLGEIAVFALAGRLRGLRASVAWLAIGAGGAAIRWALLALAPPFILLVPLQALHALSFSATHLGTMGVLDALAPASRRALWQGRAGAFAAGATALSTLCTGPLHAAFGEGSYFGMAALAAAGGAVLAATLRAARRSRTD